MTSVNQTEHMFIEAQSPLAIPGYLKHCLTYQKVNSHLLGKTIHDGLTNLKKS